MGFFKGQGATEYLVLLAVVLIIALVSIALLGFFPGLASDARITQSNSYWRGEARPFAILEHAIVGTTGAGSFVLQNLDASGTIVMTNFTVGNTSYTTPVSFAPGETRTVSTTAGNSGAAGQVYDLVVTIAYNSSNGVITKQYGSKNVIGKFS